MKPRILVSIIAIAVVSIGWLVYLDSSRAEPDIDQNDVALTTGAPNGKPQIRLVKEPFAGKVVDPRNMPRTVADIEREFNEKHPLKPSGNRGGYGLNRDRPRLESNRGSRLSEELRRKLEALPPDPNDKIRDEVHELRNEIHGAISESSGERFEKVFQVIAETGDSNLIDQTIRSMSPSGQTTPMEKAVLNALEPENVYDPHYAKYVADYLRERRDNAQRELDEGTPENPRWLASHIQWIEEASKKLHLSLDPNSDGLTEDWLEFTKELWPLEIKRIGITTGTDSSDLSEVQLNNGPQGR